VDKKDKPAGAGFFGTKELLKKYKKDTPGESVKEVYKDSGLGKWFGQSAGGEAGWDRYNTKGERVGKCGDSKPGEGKPKCLSPEKARKLRTQGGKKAIGNAAKRKKSQDPNTDRPGTGNKPINVSNNIKKEDRDMKSAKEFLNDIIENVVNEDLLNEKNKPTNPALWSKSISAAKSKFDVYPSAYANAWASKHYKAAGGSWESTNEEVELDEAVKAAKNAGPFTIVAIKNGKVIDTFRGAEHNELKDVVAFVKANNKGAKISVEAKGGKIVHTEDVEVDEAKMIKVEVDPKKKIGYEVRSVGPGGKTTVTKRKDMPDKKDITDHAEMTEAKAKRITKLHGKYPKGTHFCATHVEHVDFGHGNPIHSQHATPDRFGDIDWYDVMFEHGIERGVPTDDMNILLSEVHENHDYTDGEELEEAEFDSKKSAEEIRLRTKYRMSKDGGKDGKPYSPADMHGAMDSLQRKKARTSGVKRKGSKHPDNNPVNLKIGEAAGQNPLKTTFGGLDKAKDTASYKKYLDRVAVAKAKRDAKIKKEREDGNRSRYALSASSPLRKPSKYESVEQVDELDAKTLKSYIWKAKGKVQSDLNTGNHSPETNKRAKNVVKAKRRVGEDVEQVDELKMPEKSKRGRAVDPVIGAALERGSRRADLKADGKLRRGDAEGAESHMTNARKRKIASRVEDVELDELKSSTLRSYATKAATDNQNRVMRQIANDPAPTPKKSMDKLRSRSASRQAALSRLDARSKRRDGDKTKLTKSLAREEVEQVDEMSAKAHYKTYQNKFIVPPIDRNRNPNREKEGLEGPYRSKKSGKVFYYDTKAGKYYDADSDIYLAVKDVMEASRFESVEYVEEAKVGDTVHLGHASKGGSGVKGKVVKIDGRNVHIKNDRGDTFKGPLDRVTVGEAIRFDAGHPDSGISGKVSGKGKRNRNAGGEVRVKYKGHPAYKDDSPGLPIRSRDIGRLIKTARRKDTKPHDSKNLTNPTLTRDPNGAGVRGSGLRNVRKEGTYDVAKKVTDKFNKVLDKAMKPVEDRAEKKFNSPAKTKLGKIGQKLFNSVEYTDEGMSDSAKRAAKILTSRTPKNVHNPGNPKKPSRGDLEARQREDERLSRREGVEDMTAAQERDAARRLKPTRATVAKVGLPSTDKERASYVKKYADEKGGNPGNTKQRKLRDLKMRLRGNQ